MQPCRAVALLVFLYPASLFAQAGSTEATSGRVCVAQVANASTVPAALDRLTDHLVTNLERSKVEAVAMQSGTTNARRIRPTRQNSDEADEKQCDYTLLTQIVEIRAHPAAPQTAQRDGSIVPSIDAADPLGGNTGPVYRENMQISFLLFRVNRVVPIVDTSVLERASANVSDTFQTAMDRIANRITRELQKKK